MSRLWAATAVTLSCAVLVGLPTMAQEASEDRSGAVWVTGTATPDGFRGLLYEGDPPPFELAPSAAPGE